MKALNERITEPDFCKGIGIVLVVIGHAIGYVSSAGAIKSDIKIEALLAVDRWIYCFHMPLFFFISGYLQKLSEKRKTYTFFEIKKKLFGIIIPYVLFSGVFWGFKKVFSGSVKNPVGINDLLQIGIYPLSDLWFLYALMVFFILRVILTKLKANDKIIFVAAIVISILSVSCSWTGGVNLTAIPRICKNITYFVAGTCAEGIFDKVKKMNSRISPVVSVLVMFGLGVLGLLCAESEKVSGIGEGILLVIVAYINIFGMLIISSAISSSAISFLGAKSLYIYLVHDYAVCAVVIVLKGCLKDSLMLSLLATLGGIGFSLGVIWIANKYKFVDFLFRPQKYLKACRERV